MANNNNDDDDDISCSNINDTCDVDKGGAELAHSVRCLAPVSISHSDTSLLPCTADSIQDCSWPCVTNRLTRAPKIQKRLADWWCMS